MRRFLFLLCVIIIIGTGCGKKGPPLYHTDVFNLRVDNLKIEQKSRTLILSGKIKSSKGSVSAEKIRAMVGGCRIYYRSYLPNEPPCRGCPINFTEYYERGSDVVRGDSFICHISGITLNRLYIFRINLISKKGIPGPFSDQLQFETRD